MPYVNLAVVREQLFARPDVVARLCRDFALPTPSSSEELAQSLITAFGQVATQESCASPRTTNHVFRAAVFALASNSRRWSRFVQVEPQVRAKLHSYDPRLTVETLAPLRPHEIASHLGGITAKADARAIEEWARLLTRVLDYGDHLERLRLGVADAGTLPKLVPAVAACLLGFRVPLRAIALQPPSELQMWKVPGMGGVLASEFLRNLNWDTYKPDRHILRLLRRWFPETDRDTQAQAASIADGLFGSRASSVREFLAGSLLGIEVTPPDVKLAAADNLIWALGAYVERKGRETTINYTIQ
jgi:hypothetical protein